MIRQYSYRSVTFLLLVYGFFLYIGGAIRVHAPKTSGDAFHAFQSKTVWQVQSQELPFQYAGKQQKDTKSSSNQVVGWIYFPTDMIEKKYAETFSSYSTAYRNVLIRFRKANLIFPFHYFW